MSSIIQDNNSFSSPGLHETAKPALHNCSIAQAANQALRACKATRGALQQLRESIFNCPHCPAVEDCELPEHFNLLVDQAVSNLIEEWGW